MKTYAGPAVILLAEDNLADQELTRRVLDDSKIVNELFIVEDGVEALNYLRNEGKYTDKARHPLPDLILLDINMPRMDGKQTLMEIKKDPILRAIPVIMLTTSNHERDVIDSYKLGVNAYITKPVDFDQFINSIQRLKEFWLVVVTLPPH
ncbi:MAG: response regulator [Nitrospinae bacterium]|nr:response regulator [Nitrospinota bacterium]